MEELEYQSLCAFLASDKQKRVWPSEAAAGKRNFRRKCAKYTLLDGTLHYVHRKYGNLRVVKDSEKETILHACHKAPVSGHLGVVKTSKKICERYHWSNMHKDIRDYIGEYDFGYRQLNLL